MQFQCLSINAISSPLTTHSRSAIIIIWPNQYSTHNNKISKLLNLASLLFLSSLSLPPPSITVVFPDRPHPHHRRGPTKASPNHPSAPKAACRPSTTNRTKAGRGDPVRHHRNPHLRAPMEDGRRSKAHLSPRWETQSYVGLRSALRSA
jgi:hypothetical protein